MTTPQKLAVLIQIKFFVEGLTNERIELYYDIALGMGMFDNLQKELEL